MEVFLEVLRGFQEPGLSSADEHADSSPCWKEIKKERNKQKGRWEEKKTFRKGGNDPHLTPQPEGATDGWAGAGTVGAARPQPSLCTPGAVAVRRV